MNIAKRCHCHFVFWPESNLLSLVTLGGATMVGVNNLKTAIFRLHEKDLP